MQQPDSGEISVQGMNWLKNGEGIKQIIGVLVIFIVGSKFYNWKAETR